jgi:ABC-type multidrug transport system ATPase subunit
LDTTVRSERDYFVNFTDFSDQDLGAGKTTTINMLTGATAPTSGYAIVGGKDIRYDRERIRQDIGICLQHDCLFPQLTVREHIQFFARLKGLYRDKSFVDAEADITQAIQDVALLEKSNTLSQNLSGGMKRKLSVAIAFCGGSSVVLLDEPTSGMVSKVSRIFRFC